MRSANSISNDIFDIEGFAVIFLDANGADASSKRVVEYPYQRAARGTWSVTQWKNERFAVAYPDFNVEVIGPDGKDVHGRTRLDNIRQSWISAVEEELEEEDESNVEGPIEITKLRTVASMKEQPKRARGVPRPDPPASRVPFSKYVAANCRGGMVVASEKR